MLNIIGKKNYFFIFSGTLSILSIILLATIGLKPGIDFTGGSLLEVRYEGERPNAQEVKDVLAHSMPDLGAVSAQPTNNNGFILKMPFINETQHQQILAVLRKDFGNTNLDTPALPAGRNTSTNSVVATSTTSTLKKATAKATVQTKKTATSTVAAVSTSTVAATTTPVALTQERVFEERLDTIGPAISSQLRNRSLSAAFMVMIAIIIYIAFAFRKVTKPVASWKYGVSAIVAVVHDVSITMGVFVLLGKYMNIEVDVPFVVAILTVLGYSVNDTIVVFDRIREKLIKGGTRNFVETVNAGVNETMVRSMNTSFTVLLVLIALFFFGGDSIHYFALALIIGVFFGTYSSIFLASPLLVAWHQFDEKRRGH